MRKYLLPQREKYFKTNLHTHTNISDGKDSPEVVAADYKAHGYSILCLSDHNVTADHTRLNDEDFLLLTGVDDTIRFFFYTYMLVPVLLALIYHTERTTDAVACETE